MRETHLATVDLAVFEAGKALLIDKSLLYATDLILRSNLV